MAIVKDPVCGMVFPEEEAAGQTLYKGGTYHFCAPSCKRLFESNAEKYLSTFLKTGVPIGSKKINSEGDKKNEEDNGLREHN